MAPWSLVLDFGAQPAVGHYDRDCTVGVRMIVTIMIGVRVRSGFGLGLGLVVGLESGSGGGLGLE